MEFKFKENKFEVGELDLLCRKPSSTCWVLLAIGVEADAGGGGHIVAIRQPPDWDFYHVVEDVEGVLIETFALGTDD